jgi:hypothetical protein
MTTYDLKRNRVVVPAAPRFLPFEPLVYEPLCDGELD